MHERDLCQAIKRKNTSPNLDWSASDLLQPDISIRNIWSRLSLKAMSSAHLFLPFSSSFIILFMPSNLRAATEREGLRWA